MSDESKKIDEKTEATKNLTQAEKDRLDIAKKIQELDEKRNSTSAEALRLDLKTAQSFGDTNKVREIANKLFEEQIKLQQAALSSGENLGKLQEELNDLKQKENETDEEFVERQKLKQQQIDKAIKQRDILSKSIDDNNQRLAEAEKALKNVGEITKEDQKRVEQLAGGLSMLTGGFLEVDDGLKHPITKLGKFAESMANADDVGQVLSEGLSKVFNIGNIAANVFDTVKDATLKMAMAFDTAAAAFSKTTGLAREYSGVLEGVQKQGNRFGITAQEGGEAMAGLLANFNDFHRSAPGVQKDLSLGVAGLSKFGVSAEQSSKLLNTLNKTMGISGKEALNLTKKVGMMGTNIGISTSKMVADFDASLKVLAVYGDKSVEVFTGIAAAAKAAGVETGTLLGLAEKFDTFAGAAETTGKLNAILGANMSATEMLTMKEDERIKTLISSVQATGQAFGSMDRFTQKAIANAAGITDMAEANKIFGMSLSEYEGYEDQMKNSADSQKKFNDAMNSMVPALEKFKLFAAELAAKFVPVLELIADVGQTLIDTFTYLDDQTGGLLGTVLGGISGVILFAGALGGAANALTTLYTLTLKQTGAMIKYIVNKIRGTKATTVDTATENANTLAKRKKMMTEKAGDLVKTQSTIKTQVDTAAKNMNTVATNTSTVATKANTGAMGKAVPVLLAVGAAVLMIGAGIGIAAFGMSYLVESFSQLSGGQLVAATIALIAFGVGLYFLITALIGIITPPVPAAVGLLLAIGAAIFLIGAAVGIAAAGFALMITAIATPSLEQYLGFGASMVMFGIGLYAAAAGMAVFLPAFLVFLTGLMSMAVNPLIHVGIGMLVAIAGSIFLIGLGAKMAADSMANLISTIANSEGIGDIIGGLFGTTKDIGISASVEKRVQIVRELLSDVSDSGIKSELENLALITTGVSAGLMTENAVSNLIAVSALADTIQNIFNPDITIEMDSGAVEKLFKEGVYKINRSTG